MSYAQQLRKKLKGADGERGVVKTELQKYLNEGLEEDEVDVLTWWKVHGPRYSVVVHMARDILVVVDFYGSIRVRIQCRRTHS